MKPKFENPFEIQIANPFERSAASFSKSWRVLHEENAKFMTQRINDDMQALERIAASRTPPEFFAAQHKWFEEAVRAYGDHWTKCAELVKDALEESATELEKEARAGAKARTHDKTRADVHGLQRRAREAHG